MKLKEYREDRVVKVIYQRYLLVHSSSFEPFWKEVGVDLSS